MGKTNDQLSQHFGVKFTKEPGVSRARLEINDRSRNVYGNAHCGALGVLAELCSAHFIEEHLAVHPLRRDCSLRRISHEYHGVTCESLTAVLQSDQATIDAIKTDLAESDRVKVDFEVETTDDTGRRIVTTQCEWLIGPNNA